MTEQCYRCDRSLPDNYQFYKDDWICMDCSRDIAIVRGFRFNETHEQLVARVKRKEYWESKKKGGVGKV